MGIRHERCRMSTSVALRELPIASPDGCFWGAKQTSLRRRQCPLMTQSGHGPGAGRR